MDNRAFDYRASVCFGHIYLRIFVFLGVKCAIWNAVLVPERTGQEKSRGKGNAGGGPV